MAIYPKSTRYFIATPLPEEAGGGYGISSDETGHASLKEALVIARSDGLQHFAVIQRSERVVHKN